MSDDGVKLLPGIKETPVPSDAVFQEDKVNVFCTKAPLLLAIISGPAPEVAIGTFPDVAPFASYVIVRTGRGTAVVTPFVQLADRNDRANRLAEPLPADVSLPIVTVTEFTEEYFVSIQKA